MSSYLSAYVDRVAPVAQHLHNVSLECRPALELLLDYDNPDTVFYVDPPYVGTTRRAALYRVEMAGEAHHTQLLEVLLSRRGQVVRSGYPHPLYDEALAGWNRYEFSSQACTNTNRREVVWSNKEPHPTLNFEEEAS